MEGGLGLESIKGRLGHLPLPQAERMLVRILNHGHVDSVTVATAKWTLCADKY